MVWAQWEADRGEGRYTEYEVGQRAKTLPILPCLVDLGQEREKGGMGRMEKAARRSPGAREANPKAREAD